MSYLGAKIYTNQWGYEVWGVHTREKESTRNSARVWVVSPSGEMSDISTIPRVKMAKSKNWCDFFLGMDGDFDQNDVNALKNAIWNLVQGNSNVVITQNRATLWQLYGEVCKYIIINRDDLTINSKAEIFVKNGYGYVLTTYMDDFIKQNKELGYKRTGVLEVLKILGVLETGKDRPYDILVSMKGEKRRFYKILLEDKDILEDEADEVME